MMKKIAIIRENKNKRELRTPFTPCHIEKLKKEYGIQVFIQPSKTRIFSDEDYARAGAKVVEDISHCDIIFGIKEIPLERIKHSKTYLFFSHTIKGQPYNIPLLQRMLEKGCQLIDYERIVDKKETRLISFGRFAGLAGMIETLWALGKRLVQLGIENPFCEICHAIDYHELESIKKALQRVKRNILRNGLPSKITPLVIGIIGYGRVGQGALEILEMLPCKRISPGDLPVLTDRKNDNDCIYIVVFREEHTVKPKVDSNHFQLTEFLKKPQLYLSCFNQYLPYLTVLVNAIYWEEKYPRLVTKDSIRRLYSENYRPQLIVIGDISCDIEGGIEVTVKQSDFENPVYVWEADTGRALNGLRGKGPVIMAIDNLPSALPVEASKSFGDSLLPYVPSLARTDFSLDYSKCTIPIELRRATIVYQGKLTYPYMYLKKYLLKKKNGDKY